MKDDVRKRVREGMPVLSFVAKRLARRLGAQVSVEELIALGHPALMDIAEHFDPARSTFAAYAALKLKWAILDGLRKDMNHRALVARATALSASMFLAEAKREEERQDPSDPQDAEDLPSEEESRGQLRDLLSEHAAALCAGLLLGGASCSAAGVPCAESPEDQITREEERLSLRDMVKRLPERERILIERRYFGGEVFDAIAKDLGISRSWASRLHAQAIHSLGEMLRRQDAKPLP